MKASRTQIFCGNWKMHKTVQGAVELAVQVRNAAAVLARDAEVVIAPVFTALHAVARKIEGSAVQLAAQDCFWEEQGAYTGEVSAMMLKDVGCRYVIVGHSERRQLFGETDGAVNLKVKAVLAAGMRPIVCIGETLAERDAGETFGRLRTQLIGGLSGLSIETMTEVVIAYEPVWAIGTGRVATQAQAQEAHAFIRGHLHQHFGEVAGSVRIQYGGSVKPENAGGLMTQPDIDGALIGGASLTADSFLNIVRYEKTEAS